MKAQVATDHKEELFIQGLQACGYKVTTGDISEPEKGDILIVWNRKPSNIDKIKRFEKAGCKVIISENGYIGMDDAGGRLIALALFHHQGKGRWFVGEEPRYLKHNFQVLPWRKPGEEIVILAQRGIGEATTPEWAEELCHTMKKETKRPVRVRHHPGKSHEPVEPDLLNAYAVVTWASAAAIRAIAFGVPAFYLMPQWIGAPAAIFGIDQLEHAYRGPRYPMLQRVGWAQWTADEVISGEAFKGLLKL